jgi:ankyrin repeat protein
MLTCGAWSCLQYGRTAMMYAASRGHVQVVDKLLAAGAVVDHPEREREQGKLVVSAALGSA